MTVCCFVVIGHVLLSELDRMPSVSLSLHSASALVAAVVLVVCVELVHSLGWREVVRAGLPEFTWAQSFVICGRSQIGKYLPGNIFHYAQRTVLLREAGLETGSALSSITVDALVLLVAAALVALPGLLEVGLEPLLEAGVDPVRTALLAVGVLVVAALVVLALGRRGRNFMQRSARFVAPRRLLPLLVLDVALFLIAGLSVQLVASAIWPGAIELGWLDFTWGYALGFAAGFVAPGAPGGLGVREAVLIGLYSVPLGAALAAGLFLSVRVVYIVGDLVTFAAATLVARCEST